MKRNNFKLRVELIRAKLENAIDTIFVIKEK